MGVGGKFWDLLKPHCRQEGPDFLRDKRVAVDLSYWIVQETAIKNCVRKPHLRLTFFRTINLFSKFGAFPVFVVDGAPSPLKSQARIARFFRSSGIDVSSLPLPGERVSVERNRSFLKCVQECVELLELLGMPVLKAKGEAEALCAQLNHEGHVDACITADSDAFLFGAKCVLKSIRPNTKEPFECYQMSDIESRLGFQRKQLIAISLLVGNDHDLRGVQGIGLETALHFVQTFSEDDILNQLCEIGHNNIPLFEASSKVTDNFMNCPDKNLADSRVSHCSFCGHPGTKRTHFQLSCEYCITSDGEGCIKKPESFKCNCTSCDKVWIENKQVKHQKWWIKVCNRIAMEQDFPNCEIIDMYLCNNNGNFAGIGSLIIFFVFVVTHPPPHLFFYMHNIELKVFKNVCAAGYLHLDVLYLDNMGFVLDNFLVQFVSWIILCAADGRPCISWGSPNTGMVVDFLVFHQHWEPAYIRQRMLPMLSTIYLREIAAKPNESLLNGQYEFDSIQRVKVRYGHQSYVIKWKKAVDSIGSGIHKNLAAESDIQQGEDVEVDEPANELDGYDIPQILVNDGFLLTDENMELIRHAFPKEVNRFLEEKEPKESKRRKCSGFSSQGLCDKSESSGSGSKGVQPSITKFYRSTKSQFHAKQGEDAANKSEIEDDMTSKEKRKYSSSRLPKSVRRRLLL